MNPILQLHPHDNVAIAVSALAAGQVVDAACGAVKVASAIEPMHKFALMPIAEGEAIIKYGQPIGTATTAIAMGEHVHTHNCAAEVMAVTHHFCQGARPTDYFESATCPEFQGFERGNGRYGTRNFIGILTTVNCSATVASQIAAVFNNEAIKAQFPQVDGVVALTHKGGCGMQAAGEAYATLERTLVGYLTQPNFAGVLVVGLGCETMQIARLLKDNNLEHAKNVQTLIIQESGGTRAAIEQGIAAVNKMLVMANDCERVPVPVSELTLAVQCGGSDGFSGVTANPALGAACDLLVRHGGTVIYSETPEIYGAEHLLTHRAETVEVAEKLMTKIRWWQAYTAAHGIELNNNPSPGNKAGGLTTILEKSLGAQAKAGTTNLQAVYHYAEPVTTKGLVFMDSPGFDPVSVTGQVASGATVVCFTTGRGSAFGFKPVPSIKLGTNNALYARMPEDIDYNCGDIVTGEMTVAECGAAIFEQIIATASGEKTASEKFDYGTNEFNPWHLGATV